MDWKQRYERIINTGKTLKASLADIEPLGCINWLKRDIYSERSNDEWSTEMV
jgi:hypothetical protein